MFAFSRLDKVEVFVLGNSMNVLADRTASIQSERLWFREFWIKFPIGVVNKVSIFYSRDGHNSDFHSG